MHICLMTITISGAVTDGWPAIQAEEAAILEKTGARSVSLSCNMYGSNTARISCYRHRVKVKSSRYRPGVAQRVGRGIALLFHDRGTRRG